MPKLKTAVLTVSSVPRGRGRSRLANQLAQRRLDARLTVRDVGEYTGVGYATISRAERGHMVSVRTALRLAAFYETTVEQLSGWMSADE